MLENIKVSELKKLIGSINIIDIRSKIKYDFSHIETSINIPNKKLLYDYRCYLEKEKKYYIYCQCGITSTKTCIYLEKLGYNVINIIGGFDKYY